MNPILPTLLAAFALLVSPATPPPTAINDDTPRFCLFDEALELQIAADPSLADALRAQDEAAARALGADRPSRLLEDYTLPVVVHVVSPPGSDTIAPSAQVVAAIDFLNSAYANNAPFDPSEGVNTQTQFCLATRDPEGMPSTGITYTTSPLSDLQFELDDVPLKELVRWEPTEYINVYVVNEVATFSMGEINVEGYAYPPLFHGTLLDGIVIEADNFGAESQETVPFVHQMGHYLGLYHTFEGACNNDNCLLDGDRVCDTPPDQTTVAVPCDFDVNSCETDVNPSDPNNPFDEDQFDLQNNYLDFSDLPCYNMFTLGQAERMQFFIEGPRSSLLETNSCLPPCPIDVVADFASNPAITADSIVLGAFLNFFSTSTDADSLIWRLNGDSLTINGSVDIQFNEVGTQTLVLTVFNDSSALCIDQYLVNYEVFCPVSAQFDVSDFYATPGQDILFTNTSTGATSYEWTVDGAVVSTDSNFVYTTPGLGTYEICLRAVGDLCEDVECVVLTCTADGANCTSRAFLTTTTTALPGGGVPDTILGGPIISLPTGNFLQAAVLDGDLLLQEFEEDGTVVVQREIELFEGPGGSALFNVTVDDLLLDSDDNILVLSNNIGLPVSRGFVLRYDYANDNVLWNVFSGLDVAAGNRSLFSVVELPSGNFAVSYLAEQADDNRSAVVELDRTTGNSFGFYQYGQLDDPAAPTLLETSGDELLLASALPTGVAVVSSRMSLLRVGTEFDTLIAVRYGPDASINSSRISTAIVASNTRIGLLGSGNPIGDLGPLNQSYLIQTDLAGTPQFTYRFDIVDGDTEVLTDIERLNDGYLIAGNYRSTTDNETRIAVIRVSDVGDLIWGTTLDLPGGSFFGGGFVSGDSYYISGTELQVDPPTMLTARMNLNDGNIGTDDCMEQQDLQVTIVVEPNEFEVVVVPDSLLGTGGLINFTTNLSSELVELPTVERCAILCDEIACNGLDDDGDGLIDCCDPDAAGQACCLDFVPLEISPDGMDIYRACDNAAVVLSAGPGYQSYLWQDGSRDSVYTAYLPGTYWVTVESDNCGGIETDTVRIVDNNDLVAEIIPGDALVCPGDTVFFELINPFESVNWLPADQVDCDTCRSTFTVVGADPVEIRGIGRYSTGCYSVDTLFITINSFSSTESVEKCIGETVDVFGTPTVDPGAYSMVFTSFEGCDSTATIVVSDFPATTINIGVNTFCDGGTIFGDLTASATGGGGGPYTFVWDDGTTGPQLLNQPAGSYTVSVTDAEGCINTQSATVQINLTADVSTVPDCLDGEYAETATGIGQNGAEPYTFEFSNGSSQLLPGTYGVTVTDANGCTASSEFDVADNASLTVGTSDVEVVCNDGIRATATALPEGGVAPYTFAWSTGLTTATADNLVAGTNSVTVTDAAGCVVSTEVEVALQTIEGIELPNAIIPTDPDNSNFAPVYEEGTDYEVQSLQIFNRWGQLVFESTDPDASWDGRRDGEVVAMDVYVYRITIGCGTDEGLEFFGDLTVIL